MTHGKNFLLHTGFWLLLPVSAIQGLWLSLKAIRLPEATGKRSGVCGQGNSLQLVALGDSIIAGVGTGEISRSMPVQFAQALSDSQACSVQWRIEAANGADISELIHQLRGLADQQQADIVLISIGVNDVTGRTSLRHWKSQLNILTHELRIKWPQATVIFAGLPPMSKFPLPSQPLSFSLGFRASKLDKISADLLADQQNMIHIPTDLDPAHHDFCEDGFHPSAKACKFWAQGLAKRLKNDTLAV
jgi:lysophospholipase L1-like esterase